MNDKLDTVTAHFKSWDKQDQDRRVIHVLLGVIVLLVIIMGLLWAGWNNAPKKIEVHHIPYLSSQVTETIDSIHPSHVYAFTFYVWQALNHWPDNGSEDYKNALSKYRQFLTPRMQSQLSRDYDRRLRTGELARIRHIQGLSGAAFEISNVRSLNRDTWEVTLDIRVSEWQGDVKIKDVDFRYPIRVVKYDLNRDYNPWGLALDGFTEEPRRIETRS